MKLHLKHLRTLLLRPSQEDACPILCSILGVMEKVKRPQGSGSTSTPEPLGFCCRAGEWGRHWLRRARGATSMGPAREQALWHHFIILRTRRGHQFSHDKTTFVAYSLTHVQINFDLASGELILSLKLSTSISVFSGADTVHKAPGRIYTTKNLQNPFIHSRICRK